MFENLLGQDEFVGLMRSDLSSGKLPHSLLFAGPPASGKLTAALELARVLSCGTPGPDGFPGAWNCPCPSCVRHRVLAHSDLLLFGPRSFPEEIAAGLDLLERAPGKASAFFFVRAARKLGKRFDPGLYEGEETRLSKAAPLVREIEERLDAVAPDRAEPGALAAGALEAARAASLACRKLESLVPDAPPVFQIRSAEVWARLAPNGRKKTIIIENADRMAESARNALLKILEEPPESVEFILVSPRRNTIIATVLSRVRPYIFKERSAAQAGLVLDRIFKSNEGGGPGTRSVNVAEYLSSRRAFPPAAARESAAAFLAAGLASRGGASFAGGANVAGGAKDLSDPGLASLASRLARESGGDPPSPTAALAALLEATKDFGQKDDAFEASFDSFLAALLSLLGEALREPGLSAPGLLLIERWAALVREVRSRRDTYNLSASLLAEGLLYAVGEA